MEKLPICDWKIFLALVATAIITLYFYIMSTFQHWKKRGFPEIDGKPVPFFGHTYKLLTGQINFMDAFAELYKAAGDEPYAGYFQGTQPVLLVQDPDLIKHILVKDFHVFMDRTFEIDEDLDPLNAKSLANLKGHRWKEMRARLSPTFTSGRMKTMLPLMQACSEELVQCLNNVIDKNAGGAVIDAKEFMACFTTDVIATCAFGIRCDALKNPETSEFRKKGKMFFQTSWKTSLLLTLLFICPKLLKWLGLKLTSNEMSFFFRNFVKEMMEKREIAIEKGEEGTQKKFGDFIYYLMLLKKKGLHSSDPKDGSDEEENDRENRDTDKTKTEPSWANVTLDDITAQVMLFFSAGFETTSSLLSFALFELSSSEHGKAVQKRLREEVDRVMEEDGGKITYEGLKKMHLLDRTLNEVLRKYPPTAVLNRKCLQSYKIPGTTHLLEKGDQIFIPIQSMHMDEKHFPNATRFDPDRFLPDNKQNRNQFLYLPFGEGPRMCIGKRFAQMQARLGMATLMSKFEFDLCTEKTSVPLQFKRRSFLLETESEIWLKTKLRSNEN